MTGCVDDVNPVVPPLARRRGTSDGDSSLLLLFHPVHRGTSLMYLADLVRLSSVVQDALGRGGLSGVDVGHDTDVTVHGEGHLAVGGGRGGLEVEVLSLRDGREDHDRLSVNLEGEMG